MEQQAEQHAARMHEALERQAALHQQQLAEMQQVMQQQSVKHVERMAISVAFMPSGRFYLLTY